MPSPSSPLNTRAIKAGAGAGKTYTLTRDVIQFAMSFKEERGRWPRFVVTTFTRKATQELQERLLTLALSEFPQALDFVSSTSNLRISTIHGILDELLKEHGHLVGLKSDFGYLRESEALFLSKKALKAAYEKEKNNCQDLLQAFTFTSLHQTLRFSLEKELSTFNPVHLADNLKHLQSHLEGIADQCREVLKIVSSQDLTEKWMGIQKALNRILEYLNLPAWESPEPALALIQTIQLRGLKSKNTAPDLVIAYEKLKDLVDDLRDLKSSAFQVSAIRALDVYNAQFAILQKTYENSVYEQKCQSQRIEIKDLEILSGKLVRSFPQNIQSWVEKRDYWFIDEFQDTSPQQMTLLKSLMGKNPYYLVGDPQQSIYLFRGARSEVFKEQFEKVVQSGGSTFHLDKNYRSTPRLLSFINTCADHFGEHFSQMLAARDDLVHNGPDVTLFQATEKEREQSQQQELHFIYHTIQALRGSGVSLDKVAILVRKHSQIEELGRFLSQWQVPIHLHSGGQFWQRREIVSCVQLLKFILLPEDDENLIHLLRAPLFSITDQQLVDLQSIEGDSLWQKISVDCQNGKYGMSGKALFSVQENKSVFGIVLAFEKGLLDLGFFTFHKHLDPTGRGEGNLWKFLSLLKTFERERGANFASFLQDCEKAYWTESSVDSPGSVEKNKVNIMTVHASKGLQFEHVILPFLSQKPNSDKILPLAIHEAQRTWCLRSPANETEMTTSASLFEKAVLAERLERQKEEDLRVLYVALTRAEKSLHLSWSQNVPDVSWAAKLQFLSQDSFDSFTLVKIAEDGLQPLQGFQMVKHAYTMVQKPWASIEEKWSLAESQAVTKLIQRGQKSYRDAHVKKQQGILFHKLVEILKYPVPKDLGALLAQWFEDEELENVLGALNYVLSLEHPPLAELIRTGKVEWSFRLKKDNKLLDGQVDLWCINQGTLWVVDYKSGEKILMDKAFQQLEIYCEAIKKHLQWTGPTQRAVVYPFLKTCIVRSFESEKM